MNDYTVPETQDHLILGELPPGLVARQLERLLEHLDDILFLFNRQGVCLACCTRMPELLFAPVEQFLGRVLEDYLQPELADPIRRMFEAYLRGENPPPFKYAAPDRKSWYQMKFLALPGWPDYPVARVWQTTEQHLLSSLLN